jgi:hypothetical protein
VYFGLGAFSYSSPDVTSAAVHSRHKLKLLVSEYLPLLSSARRLERITGGWGRRPLHYMKASCLYTPAALSLRKGPMAPII